jgi:anaerobic ribonucleoside-triphosphate reductase activating protein
MHYGALKTVDIADGPGVRVTLFVSGCHIHCEGCQNAIAQDFSYGGEFTENTLNEILTALEPDYIEGFTLCGGEPFSVENQGTCLSIVKAVKEKFPQKSIWCYSGYYFENLPKTRYTESFLKCIDILVEGPFLLLKRDISDFNRWRGSTNQRIVDVQATLQARRKIFLKNMPNNG